MNFEFGLSGEDVTWWTFQGCWTVDLDGCSECWRRFQKLSTCKIFFNFTNKWLNFLTNPFITYHPRTPTHDIRPPKPYQSAVQILSRLGVAKAKPYVHKLNVWSRSSMHVSKHFSAFPFHHHRRQPLNPEIAWDSHSKGFSEPFFCVLSTVTGVARQLKKISIFDWITLVRQCTWLSLGFNDMSRFRKNNTPNCIKWRNLKDGEDFFLI